MTVATQQKSFATATETSAASVVRETLTDRIRPHLATFAKRAAATEAARMVSPESFARIKDAGFVRSLVPAVMGGDERDLWDFCDAIRTITKACPATAWVAGVLNTKPATVCQFHPDAREEFFATGPDTTVCISGAPLTKAKLVEGGVSISGRARWASGCDHAEWAIVGTRLPNPTDSQYPERSYQQYMFLAHRSEYTIEDTWYSMGQRGSGSKDLVFDNLFVPYHRLEGADALSFGYNHGAEALDAWITRLPMVIRFGIWIPAIALGCADGMIEEFTKRQRSRKNAYTNALGIHNPAGYMRLAESVHELESLSVFYRHLIDEMQTFAVNNEKMTETKFYDMLSKLPFITERAVAVVERLFLAAGSSAIADFNPMQRYWRDAHAARLHQGMDYDNFKQHHGRFLMGLPPTADL